MVTVVQAVEQNPTSRGTVCPYPATMMDFCPHVSMSWRHRHAVCAYARVSHDTHDVQVRCFSPHRIISEQADPASKPGGRAAKPQR
jgi:hypothetical protein